MTGLLLAWMAVALLSTYGVFRTWQQAATPLDTPAGEGVAVLVPVKGRPGDGLDLTGFLAQRGIGYRLIVILQAADDPAFAAVSRLAADPRVSVVIAGRAAVRGQKVHNQLAGLATLRPEDRWVVFADADVVLPPDWLAQLLRPLLLGRAEVASGYRWILPADGHLASRFCALIDWAVATSPRSRLWNLCWGGSMALSRAALDRIDLPRCWATALLDDIVLTRAARRAGFAIHSPLRVLVPSPVRHDWRSLLEFGRRQYLLVRVHAPLHWWLAGVTLLVPTLAGAAALYGAARGDRVAAACVVAALALQQVRAQLRIGVARRVLVHDAAAASAGLMQADRWLLPVAPLLHGVLWLSSAAGRTMVWAGTRYRLLSAAKVEIIP